MNEDPFASHIKECRDALQNEKLHTLSRKINVSHPSLRKIRNGDENTVSIRVLREILNWNRSRKEQDQLTSSEKSSKPTI